MSSTVRKYTCGRYSHERFQFTTTATLKISENFNCPIQCGASGMKMKKGEKYFIFQQRKIVFIPFLSGHIQKVLFLRKTVYFIIISTPICE